MQLKNHSNAIFFVLLMSFATLSNAYEQKSCMMGIESAMNLSAELDESNTKFMRDMAALLNSGVAIDNDIASYLSSQVSITSTAIISAGVISTLKQAGTFKQPKLVDKLVDGQFQTLNITVATAKNSFAKWVGAIKNQNLKDQAFASSQKLEKIYESIRLCSK
jgi:hypothetical protein